MGKGSIIRKRSVQVLIAVGVVLTAFVVGLPLYLSHAMEQWLLENGAQQARVSDIDFNPFTGEVALTDMEVMVEGSPVFVVPHFTVDIEWLPLFSRQIVIKGVGLDGLDLTILDHGVGRVTVGGIELPGGDSEETQAPAEPSLPWQYAVDLLAIDNSRIHFIAPDLDLDSRINAFEISGLSSWKDEPAPVAFDGLVNGSGLELKGELPPLLRGYGFKGRLAVGDFPLSALAARAEAAVAGLDGQVSADSDVDVLIDHDGAVAASKQGVLRIDALSFDAADDHISLQTVEWDGTTSLTLAETGEPAAVAFDGKLTSGRLVVQLPGPGYEGIQEGVELVLDGKLDAGNTDTLVLAGQVALKALHLNVREHEVELAGFSGLSVGKFALQGSDDINVTDIKVDRLLLAKPGLGESGEVSEKDGGPQAVFGEISIDRVGIQPGSPVMIGKIRMQDVRSRIARDQEGNLEMAQFIDLLPKGEEVEQGSAPTGEEAATSDAGQGVQVESIEVGGDSALIVHDASVQPPFDLTMKVSEASASGLDTNDPDKMSPYRIKGSVNKHSSIEIDGKVGLFSPEPAVDLKVLVDGLALPPVSPYATDAIGYRIDSGDIDADSTVKIQGSKLDLTNALTIRGLEVTEVEGESLQRFQEQVAVPLDTALDMLRDKHDTIKLDLPVSGDMSDPEFDASSVINIALGKAMKVGAKSVLMLALQPYGALITVAEMAGDAATKVRLDPVGFNAGSAALPPERLDYLDKVAGIMKERPNIQVRVCGFAVDADRTALAAAQAGESGEKKADESKKKPAIDIADEVLSEMAAARAAAVEDYLVEKQSVDGSRLTLCRPEIESGTEAQPRVDLLI